MKEVFNLSGKVKLLSSVFLSAFLVIGAFFYLQFSSADAIEQSISQPANLGQLTAQNLDYKIDRSTGRIDYLAGQVGGISLEGTGLAEMGGQAVAEQFLAQYGGYFGLTDHAQELGLIEDIEDDLGMKHVVYNQYYEGLPVFGGQLIVHLDGNNVVRSANGQVLPEIDVDVNSKITRNQAVEVARSEWREQFGSAEAQVIFAGQKIFNKGFIEGKTGQSNQLVWEIELYEPKTYQHEYYFVDAHRGDLAYQITGNKDISRQIYDCSRGLCYLDDLNAGYYYGRSEGKTLRGANPLYGGNDVDDLYSMMASAHDYFYNTFGRNGANDRGGLGDGTYSAYGNSDGYTYIDYYVPVPQSCPNAYNDGFSINFCNGLVYTDIVGHEYTHGVVNFSVSGGLTYSYESGALHEAYADIFGEAIEYYSTGTNDWLMGDEIDPSVGMSTPIRNIKNPTNITGSLGANPDRYYHSGFYCGSADYGGVHHNSTVVSHAAYYLVTGGTKNGCTIEAIDRDKMEAIFYRALTNYFTSSTDFNDAYTALSSSCTDLYGSASDECVATRQALQAVELDQGGACSSQARTAPACADVSSPSISDRSPSSGTKGVARDANIYFEVDDADTGINPSSLDVTIEGKTVIDDGSFQSGYSGLIDSDGSGGYNVTINPSSDFDYGQSVQVVVSVSDYNGTGNVFDWSFTVIAVNPKILTTSGPGETTRLQAYDRHGNPTGSELSDLFPSSYTGGAGIIPVDQSNNGIKDQFVIFATSNGGPQARVMSLDSSGNLDIKGQMFVFDSSIRDGLSMTSGDFDNDGYEDDLAACLTGNKEPQVRIYTDITGADNWTLINQFTANFPEVGCNLGTFQYDGNATELLVTPHHGPSTPKVYIYTVGGTLKNSFLAYETTIDQGVTASGIGERIYTTPNNGSSHIISYDKHGNKKSFWWAYQDHVRGDFKNIPGDIDLDGKDEILISPTGSNGPHVLSFETTGKARTWPNFFAFNDPALRNGVGIAVIDNWEGEN